MRMCIRANLLARQFCKYQQSIKFSLNIDQSDEMAVIRVSICCPLLQIKHVVWIRNAVTKELFIEFLLKNNVAIK